ncbi:hypothetical protein WKT04_11580 [Oscillospiraceae bacterium HCN-4035]
MQEKFRLSARKLRQKRKISFIFLVQYPSLQFLLLSGILGQTTTNEQEERHMMLCTAPKKKNSSLGIAVSVFIDIVSFDR